jgi:hypothetical protein
MKKEKDADPDRNLSCRLALTLGSALDIFSEFFYFFGFF